MSSLEPPPSPSFHIEYDDDDDDDDDDGQNDDAKDDDKDKEVVVEEPLLLLLLKSPTNVSIFSPSLKRSRHGWGLELATEKSHATARLGRRMAAYVSEVAQRYETFGTTLVTACQRALATTPSNQAFYQTCHAFGWHGRKLAAHYQSRIVARFTSSIKSQRTAMDTSHQRYMAARTQSYEARQRAHQARQDYRTAMQTAQTQLTTWHEQLVLQNSDNDSNNDTTKSTPNENNDEVSATTPPWENAIWEYVRRVGGNQDVVNVTTELIHCLKQLVKCRERYQEFVLLENDSVRYAMEMELQALREFIQMERERVQFFATSVLPMMTKAETMVKTQDPLGNSSRHNDVTIVPSMNSTTTTENNIITNTPTSTSDALLSDDDPLGVLEKKGKDLIANLFIKTQSSYEEGNALADAETYSLPEETAKLRESVKAHIATQETRIKTCQVLMTFLETLSASTTALAEGLSKVSAAGTITITTISNTANNNNNTDSTSTTNHNNTMGAQAIMGPKASVLWNSVMQMYQEEAEVLGNLSQVCSKHRQDFLDPFLANAQSALKLQDETDDSNWRQLCEIAKEESKIAARYRNIKLQHEKARETYQAASGGGSGSGDATTTNSTTTTNTTTSTSQDNNNNNNNTTSSAGDAAGSVKRAFFAGGEAMKKFQGNARLAIAKNQLQEADVRVLKEQMAFDEVTAARNNIISEYKRVTLVRIDKLSTENQTCDEKLQTTIHDIQEACEKVTQTRVQHATTTLDDEQLSLLMEDVQEWVQTTSETIPTSQETEEQKNNNQDNAECGFRLSFVPVESKPMDQLFQLGTATTSNSNDIPRIVEELKSAPPPTATTTQVVEEEEKEKEEQRPTTTTKDDSAIIIPQNSSNMTPNRARTSSGGFFGVPTAASSQSTKPASSQNVVTAITTPKKTKHLGRSLTAPESPVPPPTKQNVVPQDAPLPLSLSPSRTKIHHAKSYPEKGKIATSPKKEAVSPDMAAFLKQFWSNKKQDEQPPKILKIFPCSYRPKETTAFLMPNLHGRLYTTVDYIYFIAWDGKNFSLPWKNIQQISKAKGGLFSGLSNDNSLVVTYKSDDSSEEESSFLLGRLEGRDQIQEHLQSLLKNQSSSASGPKQLQQKEANGHGNKNGRAVPLDNAPVASVANLPPDAKLKEMQVVLSKTIRNVGSIQRVYEKVWSEGVGTSEAPFYGPWLVSEKCFDIEMNDWEMATDNDKHKENGFVNPWCGERYDQKRLVNFKFRRTSHLYIGPPVATVKQVQYCRTEKDRCIMAMSVSFDGIPYADTFVVEVRWVGSRSNTQDLDVQVGLFVVFKKKTMLSSKIQSGTIAETKNVHLRLFNAVKHVCSIPGEEEDNDDKENIIGQAADGRAPGPKDDNGQRESTKIGESHAGGFLQRLGGFFFSSSGSTVTTPQVVMVMAAAATAAIAAPVVWRFLGGSTSSSSSSSSNYEVQQLGRRMDELQMEVRALQKSVDLIITMLGEKQT